MSWNEVTIVTQRKEFVGLALQPGANFARLCERFGISRKTGYKWRDRQAEGGQQWADDRSRRPIHSPERTDPQIEAAVIALRHQHPAWGGRKLRRVLLDQGCTQAPAPSTITAILHRHDLISPHAAANHEPMTRFERELPNQLWQMDFKSAVHTRAGDCHPLTIIDDHSRFAICLQALPDQTEASVAPVITDCFKLYGLPERILMDNGTPWGGAAARYTHLSASFIRLGINVSHGRPYHPQTQGKNERFNRTVNEEAIAGRDFRDPDHCQNGLQRFRYYYNHVRPHEAIGLVVPASRYQISPRPYPDALPLIQYPSEYQVRKVLPAGFIAYRRSRFQVGRAFTGDPVGLRPTDCDGVLDVYYCRHRVAIIDLRDGSCRQV